MTLHLNNSGIIINQRNLPPKTILLPGLFLKLNLPISTQSPRSVGGDALQHSVLLLCLPVKEKTDSLPNP